MRRFLLLTLALIGGCSKGPQADLQYIAEARSLAAEWALVNQEAAQGKLTPTYAKVMRKELRQQLQTSASALTQPDSRYGQIIRFLQTEPGDAPPEELRARSDSLKRIEDQLESA